MQKKDGPVVRDRSRKSRMAGHHQKPGRPQNDGRGVDLGSLNILISDLQPGRQKACLNQLVFRLCYGSHRN